MKAYTGILSEHTKYFESDEPYLCELGGSLPSLRVAYRTWGTLNEHRDNVILICHALTGSADADAWWEGMFSAGGAFDETADRRNGRLHYLQQRARELLRNDRPLFAEPADRAELRT